MRRIAIVISVAAIVAAVLWGFYYLAHSFELPSEEELPNETLIGNAGTLEEVSFFLEKYPDARIEIDRSGRLAVDYRVSKPSLDNNSLVDPYLRLRVNMNSEGEPEEMFVECNYGEISKVERDDILGYLKTENCLKIDA